MPGTTIKGLKANLAKLREVQQARPDLDLNQLASTLEQLLGERYDRQRPRKPRKKRSARKPSAEDGM